MMDVLIFGGIGWLLGCIVVYVLGVGVIVMCLVCGGCLVLFGVSFVFVDCDEDDVYDVVFGMDWDYVIDIFFCVDYVFVVVCVFGDCVV